MAWISTAFKSKAVNMPVEVELLVPQPGYKSLKQTEEYKVLILLHGINNDRTEWLLKSRIFDRVRELPILVWMPSGKNSFFVNTANGYDYMDYIAEELPRWIKSMFRVSENRKDWLIAGASMGGYGAMVCGLNHPEQFGCIGTFSGAFDIPALFQAPEVYRMELLFGENWKESVAENLNPYQFCHQLPLKRRPRIFLCCGRQDGLFPMNVQMRDELQGEYDLTWQEGNGGHDFDYWDVRLAEMLDWFLRGEVLL